MKRDLAQSLNFFNSNSTVAQRGCLSCLLSMFPMKMTVPVLWIMMVMKIAVLIEQTVQYTVIRLSTIM